MDQLHGALRDAPVRDEARDRLALERGALGRGVVVVAEQHEQRDRVAEGGCLPAGACHLRRARSLELDEVTERAHHVLAQPLHEVVALQPVRVEVVAEQEQRVDRLAAVLEGEAAAHGMLAVEMTREAQRASGVADREEREPDLGRRRKDRGGAPDRGARRSSRAPPRAAGDPPA